MRIRHAVAVVVAALLLVALYPALPGTAQAGVGDYVVVLRAGAAVTPDQAVARARELGATVRHVYRRTIQGYSATLSQPAVDELRRDPAVRMVFPNATLRASTTQSSPPWGLDRIDQRSGLSSTYTYTATGAGVYAYVIDSGVTSHADFAGRLLTGTDAVDGDGNASDCHGHGTHVAGTVGGTTYGVAKGVTLIPVRVLDCAGNGTIEDVLLGVEWVTVNRPVGQPAVANMSIGSDIPLPPIDLAVSASIASGISYSVAAGNNASDACLSSPARVTEAMTLGATDSGDNAAWFTNTGACVDWYAPGVGVVSTRMGGGTATMSGTSMASPHNAGVSAQYLQLNPLALPAQVALALGGKTTQGAVHGVSTVYGNDDLLFTDL